MNNPPPKNVKGQEQAFSKRNVNDLNPMKRYMPSLIKT